jgi:hypothetical protein
VMYCTVVSCAIAESASCGGTLAAHCSITVCQQQCVRVHRGCRCAWLTQATSFVATVLVLCQHYLYQLIFYSAAAIQQRCSTTAERLPRGTRSCTTVCSILAQLLTIALLLTLHTCSRITTTTQPTHATFYVDDAAEVEDLVVAMSKASASSSSSSSNSSSAA